MTDSIFNCYFPSLISFIVGYYILLSGGTIIKAIFIGILISVGSCLILFALIRYIGEKLDRKRERKKLHKKRLVNEVLKREFQNMNITYNKQEHKLLITGLEELEGKEVYRYTLQHLKAYRPILDSWDKSKGMVEEINGELDKLVRYIFNKIETEMSDKYKKCLSYSIYHLIEESVKKDFEDLSIKMRNDKKDIDISLSCNNWATIKLKEFSKTKIKKFFKDLSSDVEFQKLIRVRMKYKDLNKEFNDFKTELNNILDDIKGRDEDLRGKCDGC